ncbi:MAG: PRC-barrel domain containing protein [Halalkalicoccus sp.]|nr:PRC-barrel domain containing protein [Halalkalicoccus sp.]
MAHEFTDEDREKPVRTADGERVGTVSDVSNGRASVEEEEGITDAIKEKLGWDDGDGGSYDLSDAAIDRVDDDGVWIRQI